MSEGADRFVAVMRGKSQAMAKKGQRAGGGGRVRKASGRVKCCLFIEGDPIAELRQGRDPHCNARVAEGRVYCARHAARVYLRPKEE